jgi:hypothetical protein
MLAFVAAMAPAIAGTTPALPVSGEGFAPRDIQHGSIDDR